ncbi:hypothetical protein WT09_16725 [Burkholderia stagnalis]|uniref:hypothetical protein n=1 Tax=Burkholderia stagnalis TaxID=1503054 RepID=UPI00075C13F6|nr:hypothetical protein [Burkholderia stagnalis]KVN13890.1 hypothetical protein WT09_16725 [Burkholderia stagnalis]
MTHFNASYDEKERHWLSERVLDHAWVEHKGTVSKTFDLVPGQVAILFDVMPIKTAGPAALAAMLDHAKELLIGEYRAVVDPNDKYGHDASFGKVARIRRPRLNPEDLLEKLRIYDAVVHQRASIGEVAELLFADASQDQSARKKVAYKRLEKAREMVEDLKLLELVPRDHAPEKQRVSSTDVS